MGTDLFLNVTKEAVVLDLAGVGYEGESEIPSCVMCIVLIQSPFFFPGVILESQIHFIVFPEWL